MSKSAPDSAAADPAAALRALGGATVILIIASAGKTKTACFIKIARDKPETTYDNGLGDFAVQFVERYKVASPGPGLIANAPFDD